MTVQVPAHGRNDPWGRPGAAAAGFYDDRRRYVGDVFVLLDPADFNASWMVEVSASEPTTLRRKGYPKAGARLTCAPYNGT